MAAGSGDNVPNGPREIPENIHPRNRTHNDPEEPIQRLSVQHGLSEVGPSQPVRSHVALFESDGDARVPSFREQNENPSSAGNNPDISATVREEHEIGSQTLSGTCSTRNASIMQILEANDKKISGDNVPEIAHQASTSASGSGTHNDPEEPIQRRPISEAGPSRPVTLALSEVYYPLHPDYQAKVQQVQSDVGTHANDKKPDEIATASSSSEQNENLSSAVTVMEIACVHCQKNNTFEDLKGLTSHNRAKHPRYRHPCQSCGNVFKCETSLQQHSNEHHSKRLRHFRVKRR